MDILTLTFLTAMLAAVAYVSYLAFTDAYALITNSIEDLRTHSLFLKLHIDI